ncbi:hydroxysqualene dehydroxylase [Mycobacterium celatum]|uniref:Polyprenyl synthetase n=1 Tax=Mycobacterium celatum TaxID=28045 RepID=A0A1X1RMH9_MYCCE|nr:FAD-dependent oxidoreductase [Mycobacterium celatum]ORV09829.1 polyprenyl synthetase [Mycobacterium celatum]PIB79638.1 polyprenyl synthetase [Mycobacterium celatum]
MTSVAVLGGGIGGLTAAHELAQRGFDVTVYELRDAFGGKARSMPVPGSGTGKRDDLPAEHGFRFFPGFYRHIPDTMARIPYKNRTVADHLTASKRMLLAQANNGNELIGIAERPSSLDDVEVMIRFMWGVGVGLGIPPPEIAWFFDRLLTLLCSCDERRFGEWELVSWWDFMGAEQRSPAFQKFLADGMTRTLVAARAHEMSARTGGLILCQLMYDLVRGGGRMDQVLDGPTSEVWIDPWIAHLTGLGVKLRSGCQVAAIDCTSGRITHVIIGGAGGPERVVADHYVAALPVERLRTLVSPALCEAEPRLAALPQLVVRWMNGAMFYLYRDVPLVRGHAIFIDSQWALTAISQAQFWPGIDLSQRGDGSVQGILSVDISEWKRKGRHVKKTAMKCSPAEIQTEVWGELVDAIDDGSLDPANVHSFFLDPAIQPPNPTKAANLEPLLVNTKGSWADRPDAVTRIPNLFLAADFVRTYTDLATMEAANEAARRAVNGILDATGSTAPRCPIWTLREPGVLAPFRKLDQVRWRLGRPVTKPPIRVKPDGKPVHSGPLARGLLAVMRRMHTGRRK